MVFQVPKVQPTFAAIRAPELPQINLGRAMQFGQDLRSIRDERNLRGAVDEFGQEALAGDESALNEIALRPGGGAKLAQSLQVLVQGRDDAFIEKSKRNLEKQSIFFSSLIGKPEALQRRKLREESFRLLGEGNREDAAEQMRISNLEDPLEIQAEIEQSAFLGEAGREFLSNRQKRGGLASAVTKLFNNGAVIQSLPDGTTQVRDPSGKVVEGAERLEVLRKAQASGIVKAGKIAKIKAQATQEVSAQDPGKIRAEREATQKETLILNEAQDNLSLAKRLSNIDLDIVFGRGESLIPLVARSQEGQNLIADLDRLSGQLELAAAGKLKGQGTITDSERKTLRESVSAIRNRDISPEKAKSELIRIIPLFETIIKNLGGDTVQDEVVDTGVSVEDFRKLPPDQQQALLRQLKGG